MPKSKYHKDDAISEEDTPIKDPEERSKVNKSKFASSVQRTSPADNASPERLVSGQKREMHSCEMGKEGKSCGQKNCHFVQYLKQKKLNQENPSICSRYFLLPVTEVFINQ